MQEVSSCTYTPTEIHLFSCQLPASNTNLDPGILSQLMTADAVIKLTWTLRARAQCMPITAIPVEWGPGFPRCVPITAFVTCILKPWQ